MNIRNLNIDAPMTGIILSGGKSIRMGVNKAFLKVDGIPIINRIHALFKTLFQEVIIVTNQKELFLYLDAKIYVDLIPNRGALAGLYTGLFFSSFPYAFCVACDMPFLKESVIRCLLSRIDNFDVIVPKTPDGLQPLHAVYSKNCLPSIRKVIDDGKYKIVDLYPLVRMKVVEDREFRSLDPTMDSFVNVNTPEDLCLVKQGKQFK